MLSRLRTFETLENLDLPGIVIEAVFEDLETKKSVLHALEKFLPKDAITDALSTPHQYLGLHFFSPAEQNPVVEIIGGVRPMRCFTNGLSTGLKTLGTLQSSA